MVMIVKPDTPAVPAPASRSGEDHATKLAMITTGYAHGIDDLWQWARQAKKYILSLSASAARLTEDNKRLRDILFPEPAPMEDRPGHLMSNDALDNLDGAIIDIEHTGECDAVCLKTIKRVAVQLQQAREALRLSPTASSAGGRDWSGMTTRGISAEEWATQASDKAPAAGAEEPWPRNLSDEKHRGGTGP